MKFTLNKFIFFFCVLVFLTSSFDVFLNLKLGGFSLRFAILVMILQILIFIIYIVAIRFKKPMKFLGFGYFFIWFLFLVAFIPNTTILTRNIGYIMWLSIFTCFIILLPYFIEKEEQFIKLIKWYVVSFILVALFGLIQFATGLAGFNMLTTQHWLNGRIPRINGFSYEPSYFSTYELIGWVVCFYLIIYKSRLAKEFNAKLCLFIITTSLILSTSRMGLIFMFGIMAIYTFNQVKNTFVTFKVKKKTLPIFLSFMTVVVTGIGSIFYFFNKIKFMFEGLGLFGYAGHSSEQRMSELGDTFEAFWRSPWIGYSLGGIAPAIANVRGTSIHSQLEAKEFEGMNIFAETLAASGIIGFIFFIIFLYILFSKSYLLIKKLKPVNPEFSILLLALVAGLLVELLILNMNQNILRAYLWVHIAVVNLGYFVGKKILKDATDTLKS